MLPLSHTDRLILQSVVLVYEYTAIIRCCGCCCLATDRNRSIPARDHVDVTEHVTLLGVWGIDIADLQRSRDLERLNDGDVVYAALMRQKSTASSCRLTCTQIYYKIFLSLCDMIIRFSWYTRDSPYVYQLPTVL